MKNPINSMLLAAGLLGVAAAASAGTAVSIAVGEPGFFGQIDIGGAPPPRVIYTEPVIVERPRGYVEQPPIYLHVPPGYQSNWRHHCRAYNACGQRVYFVQDTWYRNSYVPHYREHHGRPPQHFDDRRYDRHDDHRNDHHDDRRNDRHDDRHDDHRDDHRGDDHRGDDRRGDDHRR